MSVTNPDSMYLFVASIIATSPTKSNRKLQVTNSPSCHVAIVTLVICQSQTTESPWSRGGFFDSEITKTLGFQAPLKQMGGFI